ncbi:peptide ABC transporter permease [Microtetraspora sp. NBRC 13810]|uniref:ABC transporter permease n=1 Tax=Microtetraspora sp. NBRC 13810 TaxID=3030990 RepID=UPI0024A3D7A0|nr:ABC transporter permease [Microtetraspora sp. NBRC 13810]GLW08244.1 peptide ABC transporter permease [Microtetraspora sp. NBRC 13810]
MTAPLDVSGTSSEAPPETVLEGASGKAIAGRSLGQIAWMRLKRDKVAMAGATVVVLLIVMALLAPLIVSWLGHPPDEFHEDLVDPNTGVPVGAWGGMSSDFLFGLEPSNGRDLFSRVVYGARISLLIAFLATILSVLIGTILGVVAGYFRGWVDTLISRAMDVFLAFPLLVFAIALVGAIPESAFGLTGDSLRIALLIFIIGFFNWPYIGRIIRGQTLSLREREFVDAARSLGARGPYIIFRELLPNLIAPVLIYSTLLIPSNILFEAALSFLGVGVRPPTPTWGGMLADAVRYYTIPHFTIFPGMAIFITVLAFNLFGDGLRDAFDPRSR